MNSDLTSRIAVKPETCHDKPCIRGMRWSVEVILDMLGSEMTIEKIMEDHPELEREDIYGISSICSVKQKPN